MSNADDSYQRDEDENDSHGGRDRVGGNVNAATCRQSGLPGRRWSIMMHSLLLARLGYTRLRALQCHSGSSALCIAICYEPQFAVARLVYWPEGTRVNNP